MSDIIHLLPDSIANQIAAGEVIQRPASVVKELMENSIDAGATKIQVFVKDAGRTSIQVVDNGKGMSPTDARLSFERHATSKITNAKDLFSLQTMGFRGEALASIASVAQVELKTRQKDDEIGTFIAIDGLLTNQETISCPIGTSFTVNNLFFNIPARRKFLKSNTTELRHIIETFQRIVLTYPDIHFSLTHNNSDIYQLPPTNKRQRITQIFGKKTYHQLLSIEAKTSIVNISGFVGNIDSASKVAPQFFFVNGRYMRHPYFHKAVMEAYTRILKPEQTPSYFIYFDVDPATIDINVHPTKTEIKFQDEREIWQILTVCIKESLGKFNIVPSIDFDTEGMIDFPIEKPINIPNSISPTYDREYNPFNTNSTKKTTTSISNWDAFYKKQNDIKISEPDINQENKELFETKDTLTNQYFQYKDKYIFTAVKSGMMIINQQRAHTQILFEKFLNNQQENLSQQLLFPEKIEIDASESTILNEIEPQLKQLGFDISDLGQCTYSICGIPASITNGNNVQQTIKELIACAKEHDTKVLSHLNNELAFSLAKSAAIPNTKSLNQEEITDLIDKLFQCKNHQFTYDGKPIITILDDFELDKKFIS
ncbi:MAG: DNA mismatch repair endonuclease MutL [Paludibacteraceae bacterium]|nr:DNA mismatch repair endonuclease MutL [Paludibacteraceae bacterium]